MATIIKVVGLGIYFPTIPSTQKSDNRVKRYDQNSKRFSNLFLISDSCKEFENCTNLYTILENFLHGVLDLEVYFPTVPRMQKYDIPVKSNGQNTITCQNSFQHCYTHAILLFPIFLACYIRNLMKLST